MSEKIKQMIIVRKDLNMRKGKMVAQGAHASLAVFFNMIKNPQQGSIIKNGDEEVTYSFKSISKEMDEWIMNKFTKICLSVDSEQELLNIYEEAKAIGLPCSLIQDAGLTEFKEPTYTTVAIGPAHEDLINPITKNLKLL